MQPVSLIAYENFGASAYFVENPKKRLKRLLVLLSPQVFEDLNPGFSRDLQDHKFFAPNIEVRMLEVE